MSYAKAAALTCALILATVKSAAASSIGLPDNDDMTQAKRGFYQCVDKSAAKKTGLIAAVEQCLTRLPKGSLVAVTGTSSKNVAAIRVGKKGAPRIIPSVRTFEVCAGEALERSQKPVGQQRLDSVIASCTRYLDTSQWEARGVIVNGEPKILFIDPTKKLMVDNARLMKAANG